MQIELFTLCDFAQENSGKLTMVGTFDTIMAREYPCVHPQLSIVIRLRFGLWEFTPHTFKVEAKDLNGETVIKPISGNINVKGAGNATSVTHIIFNIPNVQFVKSGTVNFTLYIDEKELASIPLYLSGK